jgi:hypothetical protein
MPSKRVAEIAQLRASGRRNGEIADQLGVSKKTVEQFVWKYGITIDGRILYPAGDSPPRPRWRPKDDWRVG